MRKVVEFINKYKFFLLLGFIELILFLTNYQQGTYLVGWDNVLPELNLKASFLRNIHAVWQEYRGLGVIDGMAHAALLPYTLAVVIISKILPLNLIRYVTTFSLHLLGGTGFFLLVKYFLEQNTENKKITEIYAFIAALFYELNLITVQMFYTPLEVFSYHFAFLPWLIYSALIFLDNGKKRNLIFFILLSFISLPQAHVPSIFIVYAISLFIIGLFKFVFSAEKLASFKRLIILFTAVILINSYWGLPYFYMTKNHAREIVNSKINQMSTDNVVLRNKAFGDFMNVTLMRGFTLDYVDYQPDGTNNFMMLIWRNFQKNFPIFLIALIFFLLSVLGIKDAIKKKQKEIYPVIVLYLFALVMLGNNIPLLSGIFSLTQKYLPLFHNVFRFVFTKFSILFAFNYAILLVIGLKYLCEYLTRSRKLLITVFLLILGIYSLPSFTGNFIYGNMRVNIPQDYFKLFNYFKQKNDNLRIATLPQHSYWGWVYYQWGVRGSGFQWYGISQPTLDGAFYPWSRPNENYYWELTKAVYSRDVAQLENIFDKYQIDYLVVDQSVISPFSPKALQLDHILSMMDRSGKFKLSAILGQIRIYQVNKNENTNNFIFIEDNLPRIEPAYKWDNYDQAFSDYGHYYSAESKVLSSNTVYYPYRSLFSDHAQNELEFNIWETATENIFRAAIPAFYNDFALVIPSINNEEFLEIDRKDVSITYPKYPSIKLNDAVIDVNESSVSAMHVFSQHQLNNLEVKVPVINGLYSLESQSEGILDATIPRNCEQLNRGLYFVENRDDFGNYLRFTSFNSNNCLDIYMPEAFQRLGYLIKIDSRNISGSKMTFSLHNRATYRTDLEIYLDDKGNNPEFTRSYIVVPPMENYSFGYNLHFDNESFGSERVINDLKKVTVNPIPYRFLKQIKFESGNISKALYSNLNQSLQVNHENPSYYRIELDKNKTVSLNNSTVILSQSYDKGWKLYPVNCNGGFLCSLKARIPFLFYKENKNHVLVNNWENGWMLPESENQPSNYIIIYKPQYLEYLGFALWLLLPVIYFLTPDVHKQH